MPKLVVIENVSLDGVMQAPGRADEDTRNGFDHGGWAARALASDSAAAQAAMAGGETARAMLFGRRTYLDLVGFWLSTPDPNPFTDLLRDIPKYVASTTLTDPLPHPNSHLLSGNVGDAVAALKRDVDGDVVVLGSGALVRSLAAAGLVDRYVLTIVPIVLGRGTRLFGDSYASMAAVDTFASPTGIVVATYDVVS